jgi:hypothetical protein
MLERLQDYFYSEPGRITGPGKLLVLLGCFLLLVGAIGRLATGAINMLPTLAQQNQTTKALADIYPTLPVWWVPESMVGAALSLLAIAVGAYVFLHGKTIDRQLNSL